MKNYYLFVGQRASTGTPNDKTGRMSMYGSVRRFRTLAERNECQNEVYTGEPHQLLVAGGKREMRRCCLGMSMYVFEQYLADEVSTLVKNVDGDWTEN